MSCYLCEKQNVLSKYLALSSANRTVLESVTLAVWSRKVSSDFLWNCFSPNVCISVKLYSTLPSAEVSVTCPETTMYIVYAASPTLYTVSLAWYLCVVMHQHILTKVFLSNALKNGTWVNKNICMKKNSLAVRSYGGLVTTSSKLYR